MILKNWSVVDFYDFKAPEVDTSHCSLKGEVYGHPRFCDGDSVVTSRIISIVDKLDYKEITTRSGSVYNIYKEKVNPDYEDVFQNSFERLCMMGTFK